MQPDPLCLVAPRLPSKYHENLASAYVLHCDLSLWTLSMLAMPWLSGSLWRKITWINRLEFLWEDIDKVGKSLVGVGGQVRAHSCGARLFEHACTPSAAAAAAAAAFTNAAARKGGTP